MVIKLSWLVAHILKMFSRRSTDELLKSQSREWSCIFHKTAPEAVETKFQGLWEVCLKPVPPTQHWEMEYTNRVWVVQWHVAFSPKWFPLGRLQYECVCVPPPKFICWNPNPQSEGMRRWGLREVMRVRPHEWDRWPHKEADGAPKPHHHGRMPWEAGSLQPARGSSTEPDHAVALLLDFQPPERWAINFCCL